MKKLFLFLALLASFVNVNAQWDVVLPPEEVTPVFERSLFSTGNWGSVFLGAPKNYQKIQAMAKRSVHVVIGDTGSDYAHDALKKVTRAGKSFVGEPIGPDKQGHSTHVAGIVAARNGVDNLGIAEALVDIGMIHIYPYQYLSSQGWGSYAQIAAGLNQAAIDFAPMVQRGDFVIINLSLGGGGTDAAVEAALKRCKDAGILVLAAAGNTGQTGVQFPGKSVSVKAIAALEQAADYVRRASYSTRGPEVWMSAPGSAVWSTYVPGNTYASLSGTSMATPTVAGLAAILASTKNKYNADQVIAALERIAIDLPPSGRDEDTGFGFTFIDQILSLPDTPGETPKPEPPKPEPPKPEPPKPVYPKQTNTIEIGATFQTRWANQGKNNWQDMRFKLDIELTHSEELRSAITRVSKATTDHFTNRGYLLLPNDDEAQALKWFAHFYEMLMKREGYDVRVVRIYSADADKLVVMNPIRSKVSVKRAGLSRVTRLGITTFNLL
jgi:subtilisin